MNIGNRLFVLVTGILSTELLVYTSLNPSHTEPGIPLLSVWNVGLALEPIDPSP